VDFFFICVDKFLLESGAILFFHLNDLWIHKQINEFLDSYYMSIRMKWAVVNNLPLISIEDPGLKVFFSSYFSILLCCCKLFISIFNTLLSSCKLYSIGPNFWWGPPKVLNSKHLLLSYWNKGSRLQRKTFSTIVLMVALWHSQDLGNHYLWPRRCILSHLRYWLELAQIQDHLLLIS
jgi:hypothetical protein